MKRKYGNYLQNRVAEYLKINGYSVHNQKSTAKKINTPKGPIWVSQRNDILGCIDILAIKADEKPRFIQVTADTTIKRKLEKLQQVNWSEFCNVEVWRYTGKGRWLIYEYVIREKQLIKKNILFRNKLYPY